MAYKFRLAAALLCMMIGNASLAAEPGSTRPDWAQTQQRVRDLEQAKAQAAYAGLIQLVSDDEPAAIHELIHELLGKAPRPAQG